MVKYTPQRPLSDEKQMLNLTFRALADSTRREIITRLASGEALVTELAEPFDMSLAAVSKHLNILQQAGLISRQKDGRIRRCQLQTAPLKQASEWIEFYQQFWQGSLDSLERYLKQKKSEEKQYIEPGEKQ